VFARVSAAAWLRSGSAELVTAALGEGAAQPEHPRTALPRFAKPRAPECGRRAGAWPPFRVQEKLPRDQCPCPEVGASVCGSVGLRSGGAAARRKGCSGAGAQRCPEPLCPQRPQGFKARRGAVAVGEPSLAPRLGPSTQRLGACASPCAAAFVARRERACAGKDGAATRGDFFPPRAEHRPLPSSSPQLAAATSLPPLPSPSAWPPAGSTRSPLCSWRKPPRSGRVRCGARGNSRPGGPRWSLADPQNGPEPRQAPAPPHAVSGAV